MIQSRIWLFAFILLLPGFAAKSQFSDVKFKHITNYQGLSSNYINCLAQDSRGFVWIGTPDGLNKYDGSRFKIYRHNPKKAGTISHNTIWAIYEDKRGNLYFGTDDGGMNVYDYEKDTFTSYRHDPKNPESIGANEVCTFFEDSKGTLWVGTDGGGLEIFNRESKKFTKYLHNDSDESSISSNIVRTIAEDKKGVLWIGTDGGGVNTLSQERKVFKKFRRDGTPQGILSDAIHEILVDKTGVVWIASFFGGLDMYDAKANSFAHHQFNGSNDLTSLAEDSQGNIWVGTTGGIQIRDKKSGSFTHVANNETNPASLIHNVVKDFVIDQMGNIWVGTMNGLDLKYSGEASFAHFKNDPKDSLSIASGFVNSPSQDKQGNIWIGHRDGYDLFDKSTGKFTHFTNSQFGGENYTNEVVQESRDDYWIVTNGGLLLFHRNTGTADTFFNRWNDNTSCPRNIWSFQKDAKGTVWVMSYSAGVFYLDRKDNKFYPLTVNGKYLPTKDLFSFYIDKAGTMWIGTALEGVYVVNKDKGLYANYRNRMDDPNSISDNFVNEFLEDSHNNIWIATRGGVNQFDRRTRTFKSYRMSDGLPNDVINSLEEDNKGNLWLSTNNGISKFDPKNKTFKNYTIEDGLQNPEFSARASVKTKSGAMIFAGSNGFNYFHPDKVKDNAFIPPVYLTDLQIFNQSVGIGEKDSPLRQSIGETKTLTLSYQQSVFSLEFVGLNYKISDKNQYAYQMVGFDKKWNYVGNKRTATYTNLDPGEYTFRVKASNNDGVWNEKGTSIQIIITPPFWQTWWFRTLVVIAVLGSAAGYYKMKMGAIRAQKAELEKQVLERTAELVERHEEILQQQEELQAQTEILQQTNEEMQEKKEEIESQRDHLQRVNEHVMSSIQYARTIQRAILPSQKKIEASLPEHFVLYRPKDVVSGDFYWFSHLTKEDTGLEADFTFLAAVDCTGHGVPGAFMSIIGNTLLNEIVNQKHIFDPAQILEHLNQGVKLAVEKSEGVNTAGMDVCLVRMEQAEGNQVKIAFAGAKRPLFYIHPELNQLEKLEGDRKSIGSESAANINFTTKELVLDAGVVLYLTSDGYTDQNNPKREKLGTPKLKQMIEESHHLPLAEQNILFAKVLDDHQQEAEQRDDITLLAVKL
ncbi:MAG: two-component regulator propeller domain-containing protein [Bacteroidota bacterium]